MKREVEDFGVRSLFGGAGNIRYQIGGNFR